MDKLFSTASSFLSSHNSSPDDESPAPQSHHAPPSDLSSSAQVIMAAAKSKLYPGQSHSGEDVDMGALAGAASNLLGAAEQYGKLENTSYGQYIHKAEVYLHDYQGKQGGSGGAHHSAGQEPTSGQGYQGEGYPTSGHQQPSYGHTPQGYSEEDQGYGSGASHENRQQRRPVESEGYSQDEYPQEGRHRPSQGYSQEYQDSEEGRSRYS